MPRAAGAQVDRHGQAALMHLGEDDDRALARFCGPLDACSAAGEAGRIEDHSEWHHITASQLFCRPEHAGDPWSNEENVIEKDATQAWRM